MDTHWNTGAAALAVAMAAAGAVLACSNDTTAPQSETTYVAQLGGNNEVPAIPGADGLDDTHWLGVTRGATGPRRCDRERSGVQRGAGQQALPTSELLHQLLMVGLRGSGNGVAGQVIEPRRSEPR